MKSMSTGLVLFILPVPRLHSCEKHPRNRSQLAEFLFQQVNADGVRFIEGTACYMKNWPIRLATPSRMRKLWKTADGQRNSPLRFSEIMWIREGSTNTRAKPHMAPEYLRGTNIYKATFISTIQTVSMQLHRDKQEKLNLEAQLVSLMKSGRE